MSEQSETKMPTGYDPSLVGPEDTHKIKMTGEGLPGSHSAVFGLTPDGKKDVNTSHQTSISIPAHSKQTAVGGGTIPQSHEERSNTSSIAAAGGGVAEQMHDPRVAEKGHGGNAVEPEAGTGEKRGAATGGPAQGTGNVGEQNGGLMDKVKSFVGGSQ